MTRALLLLALAGVVVLSTSANAAAPLCTDAQYEKVLKKMTRTAKNLPGLAAAWLRAGFHDCITVNAAKPGSGCNGSLRSEIGDFRNTRLQLAVDALRPFVEPAGSCFNWADGFMAATEAALRAGKIKIPAGLKLVDLNNPRTEVADGDIDGPLALSPPQAFDPTFLQLPNPVDPPPGPGLPPAPAKFETLLTFYEARGMDEADLVSSSVIGHAIGKFIDPLNPGPLLDFTTKQIKITNKYAKNLNRRAKKLDKGKPDPGNRPGFNTLTSDDALIKDDSGRDLIGEYAGPGGLDKCLEDFFVFLQKMIRL